MSSVRRGGWAGLALAAVLFGGAPARAADKLDEAERLFDEGRRLMQEPGKLDEGCKILEQSYKLHDRGDTLLNMAECHMRQGKTLTAWSEFDRAIRVGVRVKFPEAIEVAKQRRDELAAKLSKITIAVAPDVGALPGLLIELDGVPVLSERWNKAEHHDPGPVTVTGVAKGYLKLTARVELGAEKDAKTITVKLEREPPPPPPPPPPPKPPGRPVWPWIVGGAGLALLGASAAFGVDVVGAGNELDQQCGLDRKSCQPGYDFAPVRSRELTSFGLFVGLGVGGIVALGAGGIGVGVTYSRPRPGAPRVELGPSSVRLVGSF